MIAIVKKENPTSEILGNFGVVLEGVTRLGQRILLNPELLVEFESRGVMKSDLEELVLAAHKVSRIYYSS